MFIHPQILTELADIVQRDRAAVAKERRQARNAAKQRRRER